jgi:hypothetical protein
MAPSPSATRSSSKNTPSPVPATCPPSSATALAGLLDDPVWKEVANRLVILSNGMMSFFAQNACEVAQHVRIDDETGTAAGGALFNQENVPSETLFYSVLHALPAAARNSRTRNPKTPSTPSPKKWMAVSLSNSAVTPPPASAGAPSNSPIPSPTAPPRKEPEP